MRRFTLFLVLAGLFVQAFAASEPAIWTINTREDVLKGEAKGVSISADGTITPSPGLEELANTGQPYVWASAVDGSGTFYLGTGSDGKIFRIDGQGRSTLFADLEELNVSALAIDKAGVLFAGTSPDGRVYRIEKAGTAAVYFDPKEKYIWSLAFLPDGSLAVGTGENGRIYKVRAGGAAPADSLMFDSSETHIISLAVDSGGNLFAGTDSEGLVLKFAENKSPFAILDSPLREIHELAIGVDGSVYALALGESLSASDPKSAESSTVSKTVAARRPKTGGESPGPAPRSRYDLTGAKSAVYRILPGGQADIIWSSSEISAFSIYAHLTGNGVLVGTSDKGRIYSVSNSGSEKLALQTGEGQVSTIRTYGNRLYASTSNQGKIFRIGGRPAGESSYESPVLNAGGNASWGIIRWRATGKVALQTRSGNTEKPDETWSGWSSPYTSSTGEPVKSPSAGFLQWRAVFRPAEGEASLSEVHLSYLPTNIAPEVLSIEVLPANVGLAPNPAVPIDPNIETSGMDPADFGIVVPPAVPRKLYQRGAKSLNWNAEDRNGDSLVYSVYFKEVGDAEFKLLERGVKDPFFTIDGLAFADGRYVFKIVASDSPSNPAATALTGELVSEPFDIDNTAPAVVSTGTPFVSGNTVRVAFEATESSSYIARAEFSVNGGPWKTVYADDGIPDSRFEKFTVEAEIPGRGEFAIALRVFDAVGNSGSQRVLVRK